MFTPGGEGPQTHALQPNAANPDFSPDQPPESTTPIQQPSLPGHDIPLPGAMQSRHIASLHVLRGLAAALVVVGDAYWFAFDKSIQIKFFGRTHHDLAPNAAPPFPLHDFIPSGFFPVALFFVLSGFVLEGSLNRLTPQRFVLNRIFRIYPVFWIAFFVHLALIAFTAAVQPTFWQSVNNFFLAGSFAVVPVSWTLCFEIQYYGLAALLCLARAKPLVRIWIILALFAVLGNDKTFWLSFMTIGAAMAQFMSAQQQGPADIRRRAISLIAFVCIWFVLAFPVHHIPSQIPVPMSEMAAALLVFAIALAFSRVEIKSRALNFLGDISYPLYCIHFVFVVIAYLTLAGRIPTWLIPPIPILVSGVASWALHIWIEKPAMAYGRRLPHLTLRRPAIG